MILKNVIASAESIVAEIAIAEGYDPDLKKDLIDAVKKHGPELLQLAGKIVLAKLVPHL